MNLFPNLTALVAPGDEEPPPPPAPVLPQFNIFPRFYDLPQEIQYMIWKETFPGFARVDDKLPPPDLTWDAFDPLLFVKEPYGTPRQYVTSKPNLISVRIKFLPIFVDRRPLQPSWVLGRTYTARRIDLNISMFMPEPDPSRLLRQICKQTRDWYHKYKPRYLQLRAGGPKIFFNPERDFVEMDEISLFLLWYYGHIETPAQGPTDIAGFEEIRYLQLGNPTYRKPQGNPPRIMYRGVRYLRRQGRRLLRSVVFPEDSDPTVNIGPVMVTRSPYYNATIKILAYMSGQSDDDPQYHNFPPRYRLSWEAVVNSRQDAMTDRLLRFYT